MKDWTENIEILKLWLKEGWGITYSLRKAGIHGKTHTQLLKNPEYKKLIDSYKPRLKSAVDILNEKILEAASTKH